MDTGAPWWGSSLIGLGGVAFGALVPWWLWVMNRRTERLRLNRDAFEKSFVDFEEAVAALLELPVWPEAGDPKALLKAVERPARRVAFYADENVGDPLTGVVRAAGLYAAVVSEVRETTSPGRGNAVDVRSRAAVEEARVTLGETLDRFVVQVRRSLEIEGRYRSLRAESEPSAPPRSEPPPGS